MVDQDAVFKAMGELVTYRVNAARAQSHLRRYQALARGLTIDRIDADVWDVAKSEILDWMGTELTGLKASGAFALAEVPITGVRIATMEVEHGTGLSAPGGRAGAFRRAPRASVRADPIDPPRAFACGRRRILPS
jgi:type III restriction enzyme